MSPRDSSNAQNRNQLGRAEGESNVNPYASPSTVPSAPQRAPFKPRWQARFFFMLVRGGNRPAKRDSVTGELILSTSGIVLGFFLFFLLGAPTGILIGALVDPPTPKEWWIPWVLGAGFMAVSTLGILAKERVYVSAERVRKEGPFFRQRTAYWRDVASVTIDDGGCLALISKDGTRVAVEPDLAGVADFADMLEQHLPPEIWKDFKADFIRYRQFVT